MHMLIGAIGLLVLGPVAAAAQDAGNGEPWSFSAAAATYILPDEGDYVQPTFTADRGRLHLEGRYNYEALRTGSAWLGYTISGGTRVQWEITPMAGGVFGRINGVAPGYAASLAWWKLDGYSEGEYVFASKAEDRFAYNWSELAIAPVEWLRVGLVTQRTRAYRADREIQRGPFVNVIYKQLDTAVYVFNPDDAEPTVVLSIGWSFHRP